MQNAEPTFIVSGQVAALIGFNSGPHFMKHRARLEDEEHFPLPLPTCARPLKWRADEVRAWLKRYGKAA